MLTLTDPLTIGAAVVASLLVAVAAWRTGSLSAGGAAAATLTGVCALLVSLGTGIFLITWFVLATILSKVGKYRKAQRTAGIVEKGGQRDASQVLANGGVFLLATGALVLTTSRSDFTAPSAILLSAAAAGSLAAAGADTWATEIGTLIGGQPFSLRSWSRVPVGTSGAVTLAGTIAMLLAASMLAGLAGALHVVSRDSRSILAVALGGIFGAIADTVAGAWIQERRHCRNCNVFTEQRVHQCGTATVVHSGIARLNNDIVNAICSACGAALAVVTVLLWK